MRLTRPTRHLCECYSTPLIAPSYCTVQGHKGQHYGWLLTEEGPVVWHILQTVPFDLEESERQEFHYKMFESTDKVLPLLCSFFFFFFAIMCLLVIFWPHWNFELNGKLQSTGWATACVITAVSLRNNKQTDGVRRPVNTSCTAECVRLDLHFPSETRERERGLTL